MEVPRGLSWNLSDRFYRRGIYLTGSTRLMEAVLQVVHVRRTCLNPSNAEPTFIQSTRAQDFLKTHLNLNVLLFIG